MPIRREAQWFTPEMCRRDPEAIFVYGDNFARRGKGGQAVIRDEPNALGVATKRLPSWRSEAYFNDADIDAFLYRAGPDFARLRCHLEAGGVVVLPAEGLGTGRADLERRAPRIWASLQRAIAKLEAIG